MNIEIFSYIPIFQPALSPHPLQFFYNHKFSLTNATCHNSVDICQDSISLSDRSNEQYYVGNLVKLHFIWIKNIFYTKLQFCFGVSKYIQN